MSLYILTCTTQNHIAGKFDEHYIWQIGQKTRIGEFLICHLCYCRWTM